MINTDTKIDPVRQVLITDQIIADFDSVLQIGQQGDILIAKDIGKLGYRNSSCAPYR